MLGIDPQNKDTGEKRGRMEKNDNGDTTIMEENATGKEELEIINDGNEEKNDEEGENGPNASTETSQVFDKEQQQSMQAEIDKLTLLVNDLSRRLQNAQHTIESHKQVAKNSTGTAEVFRSLMTDMSNILRLETSRNATYMRKKVHGEEAARFEADKKKANRMQDELRMLMVDHQMSGMKREPAKLVRLRAKLDSLDAQQESQKQLLQHLNELEKMTEDLATAAQNGDIVACSALMRRGANVNEMDAAGYLPIHYACANGYTQVVKLLLEFGADPTSYLTGHSPTETAARNGHGEIIKVLSSFGANLEEKGLAGSPPIVSAAAGGFLQTVDELLALGADINAYDMNENTALHVATRLSDPVAMIRLLLKRGANVKASNKQGHTPLKMALTLVNQAAIEVLGGRGDLEGDGEFDGGNYGDLGEDDAFDRKSLASSITMVSRN